MSHTKGELSWRKEGFDNVVDIDGEYFAEILFPIVKDKPNRKANMNHFVRCWNCHDELVKTGRDLIGVLGENGYFPASGKPKTDAFRAALDKAKEIK